MAVFDAGGPERLTELQISVGIWDYALRSSHLHVCSSWLGFTHRHIREGALLALPSAFLPHFLPPQLTAELVRPAGRRSLPVWQLAWLSRR